jgi:hypothetical protein
MPDGTVVQMPDKLDPALAARLKAFQAKSAAPPQKGNEDIANAQSSMPGVKDLIGAAFEPTMAMGSSALLQPIAGLAGLGVGAANELGMTDLTAAEATNKIQGASYQPRTEGSKNAMSVLGLPGEIIPSIAQDKPGTHAMQRPRWGGAGTKPSGEFSPLIKAGAETAAQGGMQLLGGKGAARAAEAPGLLKPKAVDPAVRMLADKGVTMTPGQIKGGGINSFEQQIAKLPILGPIIKHARGRSVEDFSKATVNDALTDIGKTLPGDLKGHEAIDHAANEFTNAYDAILPKMTVQLGSGAGSLAGDLSDLKAMVMKNLPAAQAQEVAQVIDREITAKFEETPAVSTTTTATRQNWKPQGERKALPAVTSTTPAVMKPVSGKVIQEVHENLRNEIDARMTSKVPADRRAALSLIAAREAIDKALLRDNPQYAAQYEKIRQGYAKFSIAQTAASRVGAKEGVATPNQYTGAVRAHDRSKGKRKFARGKALQQDLARSGRKVLAGTEPDSGTPAGIATMELLTGGGAAAFYGHPMLMLGAASIPALYSKIGLKALQPFLMGDVKAAPGVAAGLGIGAMGPQQMQAPADELGVAQ